MANDEDAALTERQVALAYMVTVWKTLPEFVQGHRGDVTYAEAIVSALKAGCRDVKSNTMRTNSYYLFFFLLYEFAQEKNKQAPTIYKALTFMLVECYNYAEQREDLLKNFI